MNRIIAACCLIFAATSLVAQEPQPTPEQRKALCEAGGGCVWMTQATLDQLLKQAAFEAAMKVATEAQTMAIEAAMEAFKAGAQSCGPRT